MAAKIDLEKWITEHGPAVVRQLTGADQMEEPITVSRITSRDRSAVVELNCAGQQVIAKIFDARSETARNACEREAFALNSVRGTGLAPDIRIYAKKEAFLVMDRVKGPMLADKIDGKTLTKHARAMGVWAAAYIVHQPTRDQAVNWFDYMAAYKGIIDDSVAEDARRRFGDLPVAKFALAKHDMDPVNFIATNKGLVGIDFETTRFKPVGWDVIAAAWALMQKFPDRDQDIVEALIKGWMETAPAHTPEKFEEIALFFARRASKVDWSRPTAAVN